MASEENISILENDRRVQTPAGVFLIDPADAIEEQQSHIICVDKHTLKFPLVLRKYKKGDIFYPKGMSGKKKISKYFKDEKLSLIDKENTWLLCSDDAIVWVVNRRADNRFRVTENTKANLKIELKR